MEEVKTRCELTNEEKQTVLLSLIGAKLGVSEEEYATTLEIMRRAKDAASQESAHG